MVIDRIGINQVLPDVGNINGNSKPADKPIPSGRSSPSVNANQKQDSVSTQTGYRSLWSSDPTMGLLASQIRSADRAMGRIESYIDRMKTQLGDIIKKYPPYPLDSRQRTDHLQEYAALRKEIERMTIPPIQEEVAGVPRKVNTELNIPVLDGGSSDLQVRSAADGLQKAKETIVAGRGQLQADTAVVADSKTRDARTQDAPQAEGVVLNEEYAQQTSVELKVQLTVTATVTITASSDRLLQALG